jgi:hypothetical protein
MSTNLAYNGVAKRRLGAGREYESQLASIAAPRERFLNYERRIDIHILSYFLYYSFILLSFLAGKAEAPEKEEGGV